MKEVKDIWQFFENMNEYVYATDIETHEIVYMNRKTLQAYGLQSLEDAKGKKCYEILQKTLIPCCLLYTSLFVVIAAVLNLGIF